MKTFVVLAVCTFSAFFDGVQSGDLHGWHGGEELADFGYDHGHDHGHEVAHVAKVSHVAVPVVTKHLVKEPVVSYVSHPVKTVSYVKKPVYTISHKPIVISHGVSYHTRKSKYYGTHENYGFGGKPGYHRDWHHHGGYGH